MAHIYILASEKDSSYYVGTAQDVAVRIAQHNAGSVRSTKAGRRWKLLFTKVCATMAEARTLQAKVKSWKKRAAIENFINRESSKT